MFNKEELRTMLRIRGVKRRYEIKGYKGGREGSRWRMRRRQRRLNVLNERELRTMTGIRDGRGGGERKG